MLAFANSRILQTLLPVCELHIPHPVLNLTFAKVAFAVGISQPA